MLRGLRLLALCGALWAGQASAQDEAPAEAVPAAAKSDFAKTERLEALRYRHLWIAYGAAWLIVFGFAWRTWKQAQETDRSLADLKRRVAEMEGKSDG
ncbi:MAG: hypothetical protein R3F60_04370 [bacterium]